MPFLIIIVVLIALVVVVTIIYHKYKNFVTEHSVLLRNLRMVNSKYHFNLIPPFKFEKEYDNEAYYDNVSPLDYLVYQLQFSQKDVKKNIRYVIENNNQYGLYKEDVNEILKFDEYDTEVTLLFRKLLKKIEKDIYHKSILKPTIHFNIYVKIILTNINGNYKTSKNATFDLVEIEDIIERLNNKTNNRFNDDRIWKSIVTVERAKVSNKMRFAVYERDNYRCRKCGRKTDLEIDHIIPIAKGGKTEFDNLQTLCKRCNTNKSDIVEAVTYKTFDPTKRYCKNCNAPMKIVNGKYGKFYGCINFPKCKYTEKI